MRKPPGFFYLVMVQQGHKNWHNLCKEFPSKTLNEIDGLWVKYSEGRFGFSIQKFIWESIGGKPDARYDTMKKFGKRVGWYSESDDWRDYKTLTFSRESEQGNLPALYTTIGGGGRSVYVGPVRVLGPGLWLNWEIRLSLLASRLSL